MAMQSTLKNMVICLTSVCLACSAVLAVTYAVTLDPIAEASVKSLRSALSQVLPDGQIDPEAHFVEVDGVNYEYYLCSDNGAPCAVAVKSTVSGFGGALSLLVGVEKGGIVHATKVLSHSETPGLGAKCKTDAGFISQFEGFDASSRSLKLRKDGGEIDAITASTITSRAYALAVEGAVAAAKKLEEEPAANE